MQAGELIRSAAIDLLNDETVKITSVEVNRERKSLVLDKPGMTIFLTIRQEAK